MGGVEMDKEKAMDELERIRDKRLMVELAVVLALGGVVELRRKWKDREAWMRIAKEGRSVVVIGKRGEHEVVGTMGPALVEDMMDSWIFGENRGGRVRIRVVVGEE